MKRSILLLVTLLSLFSAKSARADDRYFLMVFGAQSRPKLVRYTHTFATFVHATGEGNDPATWTIQQVVDISWMPRTMVLHPLQMRPQEGINLDLHRTLQWAKCNKLRVSMWGPYEICPDFFDMAVARANYLENDRPGYNVVDRRRRPLVLDCIHAVSGVDHRRGRFHTRLAYGAIASYFDVHHFRDSIINPCLEYDWVAEQLGVFAFPIRRRGFDEVAFSLLPILPPYYTPKP